MKGEPFHNSGVNSLIFSQTAVKLAAVLCTFY